MSNFSTAVGATETALSSAGSAFVENERYMDSIEGKLSQLDSTWQLFSQQTIGSDFLKNLISAGTGLLQFTMQIGGLPTVLTAATAAMITYKVATGSADKILQSFNLTAKGTSAALGVVGAAITIGMALWSSYNKGQEEARQSALTSIETFESEISTLENVRGAVEEASNRAELLDAIGQVSDAYADELASYNDLNEARERGIELIDLEGRKQAQSWINTNIDQVNKAREALEDAYAGFEMVGVGGVGGSNGLDMFYEINDAGIPILDFTGTLEESTSKMGEWLEAASEMGEGWQKANSDTISNVTSKYLENTQTISENKSILEQYNNAREILDEGLESTNTILDEYNLRIENSKTAQEEFAVATDMANSAMGNLNENGTVNLDYFKDYNGELDTAALTTLELEGALIATADGYVLNTEKLSELSSVSSNMNTILNNLAAELITPAEAAHLLAQELDSTKQSALNAVDTLSTLEPTEIDVDVNTDSVTDATTAVPSELKIIDDKVIQSGAVFQTFDDNVSGSMLNASNSVPTFTQSLSNGTETILNTLNTWSSSLQTFVDSWNSSMSSLSSAPSMAGSVTGFENGTPCYAGGTTSHNAVIDEHNKTEIVARNLGGRAVHLERGDAVLPNPTSVNLMNFGKNPSSFINSLIGSSPVDSGSSGGVSVGNINITLPSVTDSQSFANEITKTFKAISKQYSHSRT